MKTKDVEKELIKIFTSSKVIYCGGGDEYRFLVEWEKAHMWIDTFATFTHDKLINNIISVFANNSLILNQNKLIELTKIPTKALAILAITCRPAYEFYKKNWK